MVTDLTDKVAAAPVHTCVLCQVCCLTVPFYPPFLMRVFAVWYPVVFLLLTPCSDHNCVFLIHIFLVVFWPSVGYLGTYSCEASASVTDSDIDQTAAAVTAARLHMCSDLGANLQQRIGNVITIPLKHKALLCL